MSISDELVPHFFRRKMEKTLSMKEKMDGEVSSRQSWQFFFTDNMIKIFFPIIAFNWRVHSYVSRQENGIYRRNESVLNII